MWVCTKIKARAYDPHISAKSFQKEMINVKIFRFFNESFVRIFIGDKCCGVKDNKFQTYFESSYKRLGKASMPITIRVVTEYEKVSKDLVDRFKAIPTANVSDNMLRITAAGSRLRPLHAGGVLAGPAFTVKSRPGDNLLIHKALDLAAPGDVVIVDAGGDLTNSLFGGLMLAYAKARNIGGIVLNGAIRDYADIRAQHLPVYAAGVTHRGPYKDGPGEINIPIAIDGMVVEPGDLILGDEDGLICVPRHCAEEVYTVSKAKHESEEKQLQAVKKGMWDRAWVDERFKDLDYIIKV